mmetsp:Transcript_8048/g.11677  ORF Transcript_8048/g.11677 Transcript_8048/m.11677 type:complete len:287 (-) Transcript_8048:33-893(-)
MLELSDRGYIVLDDRRNRSMNGFITNSISYKNNERFWQLNLSETAPSSDLHVGIQVGCLTRLLQELCDGDIHSVMDCSKVSTAAAVLATQTRRADLFGPDLQRFHCRVGSFLADKLLDIDSTHHLVQTREFCHVQGTHYEGFVPTCNLVIIPLMRAGEPMSRGVYERFPEAKLVHYYSKDESHDRLSKALVNTSNDHVTVNDAIIVDSVVNKGKTVRNIIRLIQSLVPRGEETPRIHVLTAVMQKDASLRLPLEYPLVRFLALRVSDNKYKGRGGTDTGNRLFGTC